MLPAVFASGKLTSLTREQQLQIIRAVDYDTSAAQAQEYKGKIYIPVTVEGDSIYNTLQLGQAARVARVAQDYLLRAMKEKYRLLSGIPGVDGVLIETKIGYKNFVQKYTQPQYDRVVVYTRLDDIKKFDEAEITSQQLLDASIVLVNGDRIEVSLSLAK